ncbi:hypothetical protein HPB47_000188 [Ixodes persulcatus]|uniref:Uncharacterized protein n=1 Tax=Ixodes persulcatus TaxID=34615 RepID=A0AC60PU09_IXOPE|nr:hypothetical protein HPB47_000188 [Ixodes persulcatus]
MEAAQAGVPDAANTALSITPEQRPRNEAPVMSQPDDGHSICSDGSIGSSTTDINYMEHDDDTGVSWESKTCNIAPSSETIIQSKAIEEGLTVVFAPADTETLITSLSSVKLSRALQNSCPEGIHEVRSNSRLNVIAVDTRNGEATKTLLNLKALCGIPVMSYSPLAGTTVNEIIQDVDKELSNEEITSHLRSNIKVGAVRRLGKSSTVKVTFRGKILPTHVLLGHVRLPVHPFQERPIQCLNCFGFGHKRMACKRPKRAAITRVWQWNCRGYRNKRGALAQYIAGLYKPPDIIALQETGTETPSLSGYKALVPRICQHVAVLAANHVNARMHELSDESIDHVDSIFDAAAAIAGTAELFSVQHLGGTNFQLSVTSSSAMSRIVNAGVLTIGGTSVPIVPPIRPPGLNSPQVTSITCLYLPIYVRNEALAAALSLYGKVLDIRFGVYQDHPNLRTGTRYIRMEMKESTPVPNFLRVSGHRATFDYRGLKRVCRRCQQEGHLKAACNVPYCTRCAAFGHDTVGCAAGCGRCGAAHATVDCTQRRSYSAVAGCGQGDFPALTPASHTPKSQGRPPTTPPSLPAATVATQGSGDTSAPAEPPVTTPSEITPTSQQSQLASATDADSNASQDAAEAALSNAVETVSVHAHTPPSPGSGEVLVKEEPPPTPELRPSPLPSWSDITEDSASSSDDRLIIDEVACDKDSALPRGRDRRRGTSEELRKTCSLSRSPHGGAEDGKRGFRSVTKQIEVLQFARTARCDLLFLQETNFHRQRDVDLFKQRYGVDCFFSYATTRSSGVGVVIFNRSLLRLSARCFDPDGRYIAFDFSLDGTRFRAVGVYAPAQRSQSPAFFKSLDVHLLDARNCLLLGDFNCVVDSRRDVRGPGYGRTTWNAGELIRLMQNFDLVDCWTLLHGTAFEHTWQRRDSSSRLDRCYTSEFLSHSVTACCAMNFPPSITYISDHRPVLVELHFSSAASSQRTWRLDTRLLRDKTSRDCLREALRRSLHGAAPGPVDL